jgi:hypothetical protein
MNDVDPQAWLADVLARLPDHPASKVTELLPWSWRATNSPKSPPEWPSAVDRDYPGLGRTRTLGIVTRPFN